MVFLIFKKIFDLLRFTQSQLKTTPLTTDGTSFDARRDGPLCQQGDTTAASIEHLTQSTIKQLIMEALEGFDIVANIPQIIINQIIDHLTGLLEMLFGLPEDFLDKVSVFQL